MGLCPQSKVIASQLRSQLVTEPIRRVKVDNKLVAPQTPSYLNQKFMEKSHYERYERIKSRSLVPFKSLDVETVKVLSLFKEVRESFDDIGWSYLFILIVLCVLSWFMSSVPLLNLKN